MNFIEYITNWSKAEVFQGKIMIAFESSLNNVWNF